VPSILNLELNYPRFPLISTTGTWRICILSGAFEDFKVVEESTLLLRSEEHMLEVVILLECTDLF
jgi:hypothetical protein